MHSEHEYKIEILKLKYPGDDHTDIAIRSLTLIPDSQRKIFPHVIIFTGFGEQRRESLLLAAKPFAAKGFITTSIAIPFDKYSLEVSAWILDRGLSQLLSQFKNPLVLAGVSRGAGIAAALAGDETKKYEGLIMVSPLGLVQVSSSRYIRRSIQDHLINKEFLEKESRKNVYGIFREVINHMQSKDGLIKALLFAMDQQLRVTRGIRQMQQRQKLIGVFSGETDFVFKTAECRTALEKLLGSQRTNEVLHKIPGGHASIASSTGQRQLKKVVEWLANQYE